MGMQQVDVIHDSFFDIGGHSLLAAKLVNSIKDASVSVSDLYVHPTVASLAQYVYGDDAEQDVPVNMSTSLAGRVRYGII